MSNQGLDNAGKEGMNRIIVRWDPSMKACFGMILRRRLGVAKIGLAVAVSIGTVHRVDDLRELLTRLGLVDEDSLRLLEMACATIPFPAPFYWLMN